MKKFSIIIHLILLSSLWQFSCNSSINAFQSGDVLTLQPGATEGIDAFIENWPGENYPNRNWGDYDAFTAVAWTAKGDPLTVRCLLKFNLEKIPAKTKIKKANLSLYAVSTPGVGSGHSTLSGSNEFELLKITSSWDENKVTWNNQPSFTDKDRVWLPSSNKELEDYPDIDVTKLVQDMIDKPSQNHGIMIKLLTEEHYRRVIFGSSDHVDPSKRPKLVIVF